MYAVTDQCSFDECARLRFLISHARRRHRPRLKDACSDAPVLLLGNKSEAPAPERMVTAAEGRRRARELACAAFLEVSVRENAEAGAAVFALVARLWRSGASGGGSGGGGAAGASGSGGARLQRSSSDLPPESATAAALAGTFRARAGTDGQLQLAARRAAPAAAAAASAASQPQPPPRRRMSMSMRGSPPGF
ncbi:hypothetical protein R5R35_009215 [Gryllus longicercus]|uniref:small monomeric GTPase n=1 Tax=Gryllus longicercus TaxID=2509291 RepID=A0AAN9V567_9ORTH